LEQCTVGPAMSALFVPPTAGKLGRRGIGTSALGSAVPPGIWRGPPPPGVWTSPAAPKGAQKPCWQGGVWSPATSDSTSACPSEKGNVEGGAGTSVSSLATMEPIRTAEQRHYKATVPFTARNTFIECLLEREPSLDEFLDPRLLKSLPASLDRPAGCGEVTIAVNKSRRDCDQLPSRTPSVSSPETTVDESESHQCSQATLKLPDSCFDLEPDSSSSEFPTTGSVAHGTGWCKPCAFAQKGCASGKDCQFCHLCEPGEKKRRRKEKQTFRRGLQDVRRVIPFHLGFGMGAR